MYSHLNVVDRKQAILALIRKWCQRVGRLPLGIGGFDRSVWPGWLPLDFEVRLEQLGFPVRSLSELLINKPALAHPSNPTTSLNPKRTGSTVWNDPEA
jgi:hypothetical protein